MIISFLLACVGCTACQPQINPPNNTDNTVTDSGQQDSGDTAEQETGDPTNNLRCPQVEEEPNDNYEQAKDIELEQWLCGDFEKLIDLDNYRLTIAEDGWMKVWGRAASIGSTTDLMVTIKEGYDIAPYTDSYGSTDPQMIVPVTAGGEYFASMQDQYNGFSDTHLYEVMFSIAKPPVEYNSLEGETADNIGLNNSPENALTVEDGDVLFGQINDNYDRDWYAIALPEDQSATLTVTVTAFMEGSPLDPIIYLYPQAALTDPDFDIDDYTSVRNNGYGDPNNLDPTLSYTTAQGGTWGLLVRSNASTGSRFHWYTMAIDIELYE